MKGVKAMRQKYCSSLIRLSLIGVLLLLASGCVSLERVVDVPSQASLTSVNRYNTGLHQQSIHIFNAIPLDNRVEARQLMPRVDNLFFLVDQSQVMQKVFRGVQADFFAREMVRRFAQTMPDKMYRGGILVFKPLPEPRVPVIQSSSYTATDLLQSMSVPEALPHIGLPSLPQAIDYLSDTLAGVEGSSAVILVTSWSQVNKSVEQAVMRLRQRTSFSDGLFVSSGVTEASNWDGSQSGVCFYTLGVGNQLSRTRLETADSCGYSVAANKVSQPRDMAHFVQTVLYKGPADHDGDGIYDYQDQCPSTPEGRLVDFNGCLRFPLY